MRRFFAAARVLMGLALVAAVIAWGLAVAAAGLAGSLWTIVLLLAVAGAADLVVAPETTPYASAVITGPYGAGADVIRVIAMVSVRAAGLV